MASRSTIGSVAAELVTRGVPRYDPDPESPAWDGPELCWWTHHPEPARHRPRTYLGVTGITDGHEWQLAIASCSCCDAVVRTELVDLDGDTFCSLSFWPGLDAAIRLHRHTDGLMQRHLERLIAAEGLLNE